MLMQLLQEKVNLDFLHFFLFTFFEPLLISTCLGDLRVEVCNAEGDFVDGCSVESLGYGKYRILFNPRIVGEYKIFLYWSEIPVDSAYPLQAVAESDEPSTSHGFASSNAEVVRHLATR